MGIDADYRCKGYGSKLLRFAIDWALNHSELSWLDLGVFTTNHAAATLYERHGFKKTGEIQDLFRVHGQQISDIQMSLDLRQLRSGSGS